MTPSPTRPTRGVRGLADHRRGVDLTVTSEQEEGNITPWLGDGDALSALDALSAARKAEEQTLETAPPPAEAHEQPTRIQEAAVVAVGCGETRPWAAQDCQAYFDERAGIAEYDGGLIRAETEALAFEGCVTEWLERHPVRSPPHRAAHYGGSDRSGDPLFLAGGDLACWEP